MAYPSTISTLASPTASDRLNSPSHSTLHNAENAGITEVQTFVGTLPASAVGTLIYDIRSPDSNGGGHVQTANKGGTGYTSYTKGDLLVGQSASMFAKLAVGTDGQTIVADSSVASGIKWGIPGAIPTMRVYSGSTFAIWNKPSTLSYAVIQLQAPGGNGGAGDGNAGGGGGGGGAFSQVIKTASQLPIAASVWVRGTNTGSVVSYFGSILQNRGGTTATAPGSGAVAGSVLIAGDFNDNGQAGSSTPTGSAYPGAPGGNSFLGKGGVGGIWNLGSNTVSTNGQSAIYGGGGGGSTPAADGSPTGTGGTGGDGVLIIYEY